MLPSIISTAIKNKFKTCGSCVLKRTKFMIFNEATCPSNISPTNKHTLFFINQIEQLKNQKWYKR